MPTYDHKCRYCRIVWQEEYSVHDEPPQYCPECKSPDVYRMIGAPAFQLKGSGWASDGYYKHAPLDSWKGRIKLYDRKEDYQREAEGEAKERKRKMLKAQNEVIKRTIGPDDVIREKEATRKIEEAGKKAREEV